MQNDSSIFDVSILSYNIQQRPFGEGLKHFIGLGHTCRSFLSTRIMPGVLLEECNFPPSIIILNEAFTGSLVSEMRQEFAKFGYFGAAVLNGKTQQHILNGGVVVFSLNPILEVEELVFKNSACSDVFAAKGCLYVKTTTLKHTIHIFATHLNASYCTNKEELTPLDLGSVARSQQILEIAKFIQGKKITNKEPVFLAGDFNIDFFDSTATANDSHIRKKMAFQYFLAQTRMIMPKNSGICRFSYFPSENSLINDKNEKNQLLDYILFSEMQKMPQKSSFSILQLKVPIQYRKIGLDFSDHYPVFAKFTFQK